MMRRTFDLSKSWPGFKRCCAELLATPQLKTAPKQSGVLIREHHQSFGEITRGRSIYTLPQGLPLVQSRPYTKMQIAPLQEAALHERCILVDENDQPIGEASKRDCHRVSPDNSIPLHRAFSVFLFNDKGDLLLQKRSTNKVTFPGHYTNTCCSHPLAEIPGETVEKDVLGIRRAAQRRLCYELGIPMIQAQPDHFSYLTRIHYHNTGDGYWGEHEIDYILFLQKDQITLDPNPDEVSEVRWVSRSQIHDFVRGIDSPLTPWFSLILQHKLPLWWDNLQALDKFKDHSNIERY